MKSALKSDIESDIESNREHEVVNRYNKTPREISGRNTWWQWKFTK